MRQKNFLVAGLAILLFHSHPLPAANALDIALTGQVSSAGDGAMEGVLVSVKKDGASVTITVVSDDQGRYRFPAAKLSAGKYTLRARAAGYDLDGKPTTEI
ncbi:MAG TPA: carboxypeptidase-like regulatory domain-containing protein, partial [Candidatus Binatus sp.]|nr:carboxypeptidase-like regulatory domain-containing protein [Candidatus Binatus sp.]